MDNECSQLKALYNYINDGYLIIESGCRSGKTETLIKVIKYWIKHQAKDREVCEIRCRTYRSFIYFISRLKEMFIDENISFKQWQNKFEIIYDNKQIYIKDFDIHGHKVTLKIGDEVYIEPECNAYTACAYTQIRKITTLEYSNEMKEQLKDLRKSVSKEFFEQQFGRYL